MMKTSKTLLAALAGAIVLAFLPVHDAAAGPAAPADREFLTLKRDLVISDRTLGKNEGLLSIWSLRVDDKGTMYVLDGLDKKVKVFGADGSLIRSFGKAGQGPGEFQNPSGLLLGKDGSISIKDGSAGRIIRFSADGNFIDYFSMNDKGIVLVKLQGENEAAFYGVSSRWEGRQINLMELVGIDKRTKMVSVLSQARTEYDPQKMEISLSSFLLRTRSNGDCLWTTSRSYEFFLEPMSGRRVSVLKHDRPKVRFTEKDRESWTKTMYGDDVPKDVELVWPEYYPPIAYMVLDDRDWLYVRTFEKDEAGRSKYDVFDAGYDYRGSFHFGPDIMEIRNGRAYVKTEDEEGFPVIERYEMSPAK